MRIRAIVKHTDRGFIDIIGITDGELLVQVQSGTQNKTLLGPEGKSPEKQLIVLYPETALEFQRGIGQVDEQETGRDRSLRIDRPFVRPM